MVEILEELATLSEGRSWTKKLTLCEWSEGKPAKLDIRTWVCGKDGCDDQPGRGVTLTKDEARTLCDALNAYLARSGV